MTKLRRSSRSKPVQKGNPHEITRHQHVFPAASIRRFQRGGRVNIFDIHRATSRFARPEDRLFCADRAWSHGTEVGIMKGIEDRFQEVANRILSSERLDLCDQDFESIAMFYSLWQARAEHRRLSEQDVKVGGTVAGGNVLSMDERERLEKLGAFVIPGDGTFPMRDANSIIVTFSIYKHKAELSSKSWGLIEACDGEFCVPDKPSCGVLPLTPSLAVRVGTQPDRITRDDLADLNRRMFVCAKEYVFARDLAKCPGISIRRST